MNDAADRLEVQLTAMQKEIQEAEREQRRSAALGIAAPSILTSQESIKKLDRISKESVSTGRRSHESGAPARSGAATERAAQRVRPAVHEPSSAREARGAGTMLGRIERLEREARKARAANLGVEEDPHFLPTLGLAHLQEVRAGWVEH